MLKLRMKPSLLIIGGVKCGSTSLFRYLIEHPDILPGKYKEPAFFNEKNLAKAVMRFPKYLQNFPLKNSNEAAILNWPVLTEKGQIKETIFSKKRSSQNCITLEASATYNYRANPWVVRTVLPNAKIIFLVRNPTERFISHWRMFKRFHQEGRAGYRVGEFVPFVEGEIAAFRNRMPTRILSQGLYYDIICKWEKQFCGEKIRLIESNKLQNTTTAQNTLNQLTEFLQLQPFDFADILSKKFNVAPLVKVEEEAKSLLDSFYQESNEKFKTTTGIDLEK